MIILHIGILYSSREEMYHLFSLFWYKLTVWLKGLASWSNPLGHHFQHWLPILWWCFQTYSLSLQSSSLLMHLARQQVMAQVPEPNHPRGRWGRGSWLRALSWSSPGSCSHLVSEPANGSAFCLFFFFCLSAFLIKISAFFKKKKKIYLGKIRANIINLF